MHGMQLAATALESGLISQDQLRIAQTESRKTGKGLEDSLLASGFITQSLLRDMRGLALGKSTVELKTVIPERGALTMISSVIARRHVVLPLSYHQPSQILDVAMATVNDLVALDAIAAVLPEACSIDVRLASSDDILNAIDRHYGVELSIDGILEELDSGVPDNSSSDLVAGESGQPVVRLVDALLIDAVRHGASDLHFESESNFLRIRYRLDGVLKQIRSLHKDYWAAMLVRIKVLCGMNIAETRAPQDGRMSLLIDGRTMDFRVSCFPGSHGECVVLRLLDRGSALVALDELGLNNEQHKTLRTLADKPQGLIIVTGPTGSGKSTTLYAMLNQIRNENINIVTMEDPVEYCMPLVRQCSVNRSLKLDFATGVRSILRQDPDVIMVGETRDRETCEMVARATLTGHLVLTTLHTNSALGAFMRLHELGLNLGHLADNVLALIAQRLVRKLCPQCKEPAQPTENETRLVGECDYIYIPSGCRHCDGIGYRGRVAIAEMYLPSLKLNELLASGANPGELALQAQKDGYTRLTDAGVGQVQNGITSLAELQRVLGLAGSEQ